MAGASPTQENLLSIRDVATMFAISPRSVYRLIREDGLPHFRIRSKLRFSVESLHSWVCDRTSAAPGSVGPVPSGDLMDAFYARTVKGGGRS